MRFGFFKNSRLVDSCHAESITEAKSTIEYDDVHQIIDYV